MSKHAAGSRPLGPAGAASGAQPARSAGGGRPARCGSEGQPPGPGSGGGHGDQPVAGDAVAAVRALARAARMLEKASGDLTLAHYRVLVAVAAGDERASGVARRLALGKPAISAAVEALCQHGLLERGEVRSDQRASALALTEEGRRCLARTEEAMVDWLSSLCAPAAVSGPVVDGLCRLGEALDAASQERNRTAGTPGTCQPATRSGRP